MGGPERSPFLFLLLDDKVIRAVTVSGQWRSVVTLARLLSASHN